MRNRTIHKSGWLSRHYRRVVYPAITLLLLLTMAIGTVGTVLSTSYEKYTVGGDAYGAVDDWMYAQTFMAESNHNVDSVKLSLQKTSGYVGTVTVSIKQAVSGGGGYVPTGADLCSGNISSTEIGTSFAWEEIDLGTGTSLVLNDYYAIVVTATDPGTEDIRWEFDSDASGGGYANGNFADYVGGWTPHDYDFMFEVLAGPALSTSYEKYRVGGDTYGAVDDWMYAQTFMAESNHNVDSVKLSLQKTSGYVGTVAVSIRQAVSVVGGGYIPTGGDLCSGTISSTEIGTSWAWEEIDLGTGTSLVLNDHYAIVVTAPDPGTDDIRWEYDSDASGGGYANGNLAWWNTHWYEDEDLDFMFEVLAGAASETIENTTGSTDQCSTAYLGQSFTPTRDIAVTGAQLYLGSESSNIDVKVQVRSSINTDSGPSTTSDVLSVDTTVEWKTFDFSSPFYLTGGTTYYLVISSTTGNMCYRYNTSSSYTGGDRLTGTGPTGYSVQTGDLLFKINNIVTGGPPAPTLVSPANGATIADTTPTLDWDPVTGIGDVTYSVRWDDENTFSGGPPTAGVGNNTDYTISSGLAAGTWYWQVQAYDDSGGSGWSSYWSFTIPSPPAPTLVSPANGTTTSDNTVYLDWSGDYAKYHIQVDNNSDFSSLEYGWATNSTSQTTTGPLANDTYYWHVRVWVDSSWGPWSETWTFTVTTSGATTTVGDGSSPVDKYVRQSSVNKALSAFTLSTDTGTDTVTGLIVIGTGTTNVALNGVKLWLDGGSQANEWDGTDTQIGSGITFSTNEAHFTGLSIPVNSTPTQYLITYDIAASPTNGATLTAYVDSVSATNSVNNNDDGDATLTIDDTQPTVSLTAYSPDPTNDSTPSYSGSASDVPAGSEILDIEFKVDGGIWTDVDSFTPDNPVDPFTFATGALADGTHTIYARAMDEAGNWNEDSDTLTIDTTDPTVTINQAGTQADPTSASPIDFTVVFSEPVTGFATGDVDLSGGTAPGTLVGTVTEISPNDGTTYNVAVSGMTGDGTIIATIPADAASDAASNGNEASTSTDNTVTYDTSGGDTPPVANNNSVSTSEDTPMSFVDCQFLYSDVDGDLRTAVKIMSLPSHGTLKYSGSTLTTTPYTIDEADISNLSFEPAANENGSPYATFGFQVQAGGAWSANTANMTIAVTPVNDYPEITQGPSINVTMSEDGWPTDFSLTLNATDVDGDTISWSITWGASHGSAVASGTGPAKDIGYGPTPDYWGSDTFDVTVTDGQGGWDTIVVFVTIESVNDPPVNTVPGAQNTYEDTSKIFSGGNAISVADVDVAEHIGGDLEVTLSVLHGTLTLSGTTGLLFSVGDGADDATMTFTGTVAAINTTLDGLVYSPTLNYNGSETLTIITSDQGYTGSGGVQSDTDTVSITVDSVNDAPSGTDNTVTTPEDTDYIFAIGDFGFSDTNDLPSDSLLAVRIGTLPSEGALESHGSLVSAGDYIPAANISAGDLVFIPDPDESGTAYASFTFQVQDDGGTAHCGVNLDQSANTMTIDVTPTNDCPVIDYVSPASQTVQYSDLIDPITIVASDADGDPLILYPPSVSPALIVDNSTSNTWIVSGQFMQDHDYDYTIQVYDGECTTDAAIITRIKECVTVRFDNHNPMSVEIDDAGDLPTAEFTVHIKQSSDGYLGWADLAAGDVEMKIVPVGGGPTVDMDWVSNSDLDKFSDGAPVSFTFVPESGASFRIGTYIIEVTVNNDYYKVCGGAESLLMVYDPDVGASGSGTFEHCGDTYSFAFLVNYNKKGKNLRGSLVIIRALSGGGIYRIKSNALYELAVDSGSDGKGDFDLGSFSGKCTYIGPDVLDAYGDPQNVGGQEFIVYLEDYDVTGNETNEEDNDEFWFTVLGRDFTLDFNSNYQADSGEIMEIDPVGDIIIPDRPTNVGRGRHNRN